MNTKRSREEMDSGFIPINPTVIADRIMDSAERVRRMIPEDDVTKSPNE